MRRYVHLNCEMFEKQANLCDLKHKIRLTRIKKKFEIYYVKLFKYIHTGYLFTYLYKNLAYYGYSN